MIKKINILKQEKKLICKCDSSFCYLHESKIKSCTKNITAKTKDIIGLYKAV